ncbi:MAG: dicarboxylate transporter/tellurite-resistance protein TehA [Akkermansiaceae bacterium]|nr:dicarboxylate transporter/tellurite-resistance protein TehA [Armatimonadota bacterium]
MPTVLPLSPRLTVVRRPHKALVLSLPLVPASFFGMVLGLLGLGGAWRAAHRVWVMPAWIGEFLMVSGTLVFAVLIVLFGAKWLVAREAALREANDPVQCCFLGLVGVTTSLVAVAAFPYSRPTATYLFAAGTSFTLWFALWRTGRLWQGGRDPGATTPVPYLPAVAGTFVTAIAASALGYSDWGRLAFGAGVFSWLAIESVLLHRLYTGPVLPAALRPTLGIQLAPPMVGAVAYLSVTVGPPGLVAYALLGYGLLQALLLLRLLPWIGRQSFSPSYWSFSFGATALATAPLRTIERGDNGPPAVIAVPCFVAANLVLAALAVGTLNLAARRRLLSGGAPDAVPTTPPLSGETMESIL